VTQEGAGNVSGSLAQESAQNGGEFAQNRNIDTSSTNTAAKAQGTTSSSDSSGSGGAAVAGTAPTYVNNQYIRDSGGPHGKNITEDPEMTGRPAKLAEPGSKDDPARVAEQEMLLKQTRGAPGTGERQEAAGNQQPYGALDNETAA
jgi:hypothetical protein